MSVIVSDLYSVVLKAGISAAIAAGSTGPKMEITGFRIGALSAQEGAVARKEDTDVDEFVYQADATEIYYAELPEEDACLFRIILDENVGNFNVGQICLMIGDVAFSKSVLYARQSKWKSNLPGLLGNNISFDIVLALSDAQACINLTLLKSLYALLPEVADETLLPSATSSFYNAYIVRNHTILGVPCIALRRNGVWSFSAHRAVAGQGEGVLALSPELFDSSVKINMAVYRNNSDGKYYPADTSDVTKFPIGVRSSLYEITQTGYIKRYASDDIWPANLTAGATYYVNGTTGSPGLTPTYQVYGRATQNNNLMYIDMSDRIGVNSMAQTQTLAGVRPLHKDHQHPVADSDNSGFMSEQDFERLYNPSSFIYEGGGIDVEPIDNGDKVKISLNGEVGFLIDPDAFDPNLKSGAPVCLRLINNVRTWIAADPADGKRPEGLLSDDRKRIVVSGRMTVKSGLRAWPNPMTIGGVYYSGEGANAGKVLGIGNWIIGNATGTDEMIVALEPLASTDDHLSAVVTPASAISNKNASPAGVIAMLKDGWMAKATGVSASRGIKVVLKTTNPSQAADVDVQSTLGDGSRRLLASTGLQTTVPGAVNPLTLTPSSLQTLTQYAAITPFSFAATGGAAPYTFAINAGALPHGLALASNGAVTGTPMTSGPYSFAIKATDSAGKMGTRTYTGDVNATAVIITMSPASLPQMTQNTALSATQLSSAGGYSPYTYKIDSGAFPTGVVMDSTGNISGTPTLADTFGVTVRSTDIYGNYSKKTYSGTVAAQGVNLTLVSASFQPQPSAVNRYGLDHNQTLDLAGYISSAYAIDINNPDGAWIKEYIRRVVANSTHYNYYGGLRPAGSLNANNVHGIEVYGIVDWRRDGFFQNIKQNWYNRSDTGAQDSIQLYLAGYLPKNAFTRIDIPGIGRMMSADATVVTSKNANFFYQNLPASVYPPEKFSSIFALRQDIPATMWSWPKPAGTNIASGNVNIL